MKIAEQEKTAWWTVCPGNPDRVGATRLLTRCMRQYGWDEEYAERVLRGYNVFLKLKMKFEDWNDKIIWAPEPIRLMWQHHILNMKDYYSDCQVLFGKILWHRPDAHIESDAASRIQTTRISLMARIGKDFDHGIWNFRETSNNSQENENENHSSEHITPAGNQATKTSAKNSEANTISVSVASDDRQNEGGRHSLKGLSNTRCDSAIQEGKQYVNLVDCDIKKDENENSYNKDNLDDQPSNKNSSSARKSSKQSRFVGENRNAAHPDKQISGRLHSRSTIRDEQTTPHNNSRTNQATDRFHSKPGRKMNESEKTSSGSSSDDENSTHLQNVKREPDDDRVNAKRKRKRNEKQHANKRLKKNEDEFYQIKQEDQMNRPSAPPHIKKEKALSQKHKAKDHSRWTFLEKRPFNRVLKNSGVDMEKLKAAVPNRSEEEVEARVQLVWPQIAAKYHGVALRPGRRSKSIKGRNTSDNLLGTENRRNQTSDVEHRANKGPHNRELLHAISRFGSDYRKLKKALPDWTMDQLEYSIQAIRSERRGKRWDEGERDRLIAAIENYGYDDRDLLETAVGTRSWNQISPFAAKIRQEREREWIERY